MTHDVIFSPKMTPFSPKDVVIFTNCEAVKLTLFGNEIGTKKATDSGSPVPRIPVILNHLGTPKKEDLLEGQKYWEGMQALANLEQVSIKLSMLTYPNKNWHQDPLIKETVNKVIDLFGIKRCIFASNYPVEKLEGWNAQSMYQEFQKLVDHRSQEEQDALFGLNAMRIYRA